MSESSPSKNRCGLPPWSGASTHQENEAVRRALPATHVVMRGRSAPPVFEYGGQWRDIERQGFFAVDGSLGSIPARQIEHAVGRLLIR
jgi:hypothetical protein